MWSKVPLTDPLANDDRLDQLFLDCSELESLAASIMQAIDSFDPADMSATLSAAHLMKLACQIEATEKSLIAVAHRIIETADAFVQHQGRQVVLN